MRIVKLVLLGLVVSGALFTACVWANNSGNDRRVRQLDEIDRKLSAEVGKLDNFVDQYNEQTKNYQDDPEALLEISGDISHTSHIINAAFDIRKKMDPYNPNPNSYTENLANYRYLTDLVKVFNTTTEQKLKEYDEKTKNSPK